MLDPPGAPDKSLELGTTRQPDGTWAVSDVALPQPGIWTVRVTIIAQSGETIVLDAPIAIGR